MRFLVTACGGDISQAIVRILKNGFPNSFVIGTDAKEEPFAANLVDQFFHLPVASDKHYMEEVARLLTELDVDIFIPVSEAEIKVVSNSALELSAYVLKAPSATVEIFLDKFKTFESLSALGNFVPKSLLVFDEKILGFPCVVKPRSGRGSNDVHICLDERDVEFYSQKIETPIFQELLEPREKEITCGVYRSTSGHTQVIQLHRRLSGGRTSWAQVIYDEEIDSLCRQIADEFSLIGSINVQLISTSDGPKVFEVNPRYSSTVEMRDKLGFRDLIWSINDLLYSQEPEVFKPSVGTHVGKVDSTLVFGNSFSK